MIRFKSISPPSLFQTQKVMVKKHHKRKRYRCTFVTLFVAVVCLRVGYYHYLTIVMEPEEGGYNQDHQIPVILNSTNSKLKTGSLANCSPNHHNDNSLSYENSTAINFNHDLDPLRTTDAYTGTIQVSCQPIQYRINTNQFITKKNYPLIIVGVLSSNSQDGKNKRNSIRQTWAKSAPKQFCVFFLVAGSWDEIKDEFNYYNDILWINQKEVYNGEQSVLTIKTYSFIAVMDRISKMKKVSYSHLFKTDDDSYVNLNALQKEVNYNHGDYIGHCQDETQVVRDDSYKWPLSYKTYPEEYFPKYCQGAGYILSRKFVQCSSSLNHIGQVRFMPFEDAAVGILAERCGVNPTLTMTAEIKITRYNSREAKRRTKVGDKRTDGLVPVAACMTERIVQHRVIDDNDMKELHKTVLDPEYCVVTRRRRRERIDYFESKGVKWYG